MRVLVVDDSVFMRTVIKDILSRDTEIEVVGTAVDGFDALEKIDSLAPDLVTLDIEMPRKTGIEVLEELAGKSVRPRVLMLSSLTTRDAEMTRRAIELGADDFLFKPKGIGEVRGITDDLIAKVRHLVRFRRPDKLPARSAPSGDATATRLVMIGSSAGGPQQLDVLLADLSPDLEAAVIVTQHMPVGFTAALAERFRRISGFSVAETSSGDLLQRGRILVSRAGFHTVITGTVTASGQRSGKIVHSSSPPEHGVRPAVDRTFASGAQVFGPNVVSVVLSGMGNDAGEGARAVKQGGGTSLICAEEDCLVYGMARSTIERNAVDQVVPLKKMAREIERAVARMEG
jgi:two-component system chemotaxis response regulator CheB